MAPQPKKLAGSAYAIAAGFMDGCVSVCREEVDLARKTLLDMIAARCASEKDLRLLARRLELIVAHIDDCKERLAKTIEGI